MNTKLKTSLGIFLALLVTAMEPGQAADSDKSKQTIEGTWRWNFTMPDGSVTRPKLSLVIEEGKLTGITSYRPGTETRITNAALKGDQLFFQVIRGRGDAEIVTTYSGKWNEKTIKGKIESNWAGEKQSFNWDAQRANFGVEGV